MTAKQVLFDPVRVTLGPKASAYRKILVAVDGSEAAARGLREALRLAKAEAAQLCIAHVVDDSDHAYTPLSAAPPPDIRPLLIESGRRLLAEAAAQAKTQGVEASAILREAAGGVAPGILALAAEHGVDLIVLGTHGRRGVRRLVLGSDAEQVVRTASVPVLLVRV